MVSEKILAIKFKYLGDVAIMVPALRSIKEKWPNSEIHVLVAEEAIAAVSGISWIHKIWSFPRVRGKSNLSASWPVIKQLRAEHFDRSVDFVGNDRGAIISKLIGAKIRLGSKEPKWKPIRSLCFNEQQEELDTTRHEIIRDIHILSKWGIEPSKNLFLELPKPALDSLDSMLVIPPNTIVCHLSTSASKKEWSLKHWAELANHLRDQSISVLFSSGPTKREKELLNQLCRTSKEIKKIPETKSLEDFLIVISQAQLFITPDTAPLHLAAAMGVPTHGLFGPTTASRWAPPGEIHSYSQVPFCSCSGHVKTCLLPTPCIDRISVKEVIASIQNRLPTYE